MIILFDHWKRTSDGFVSENYEQFGSTPINGRSRVMPGPAVPVLEAGQSIGRLRIELVGGKFRAMLTAGRPTPVCVSLVIENKQSVRLAGASVSTHRIELAG